MKPIKFKPRKTLLGRLRELRRILTSPKHWTKGSYAKYLYPNNASGGVFAKAKLGVVCAVCLEGGTLVVDNGSWGPTFNAVRRTIEISKGYMSIPSFNDNCRREHPEILEVIDKTIDWVKAHGGGRRVIHD